MEVQQLTTAALPAHGTYGKIDVHETYWIGHMHIGLQFAKQRSGECKLGKPHTHPPHAPSVGWSNPTGFGAARTTVVFLFFLLGTSLAIVGVPPALVAGIVAGIPLAIVAGIVAGIPPALAIVPIVPPVAPLASPVLASATGTLGLGLL